MGKEELYGRALKQRAYELLAEGDADLAEREMCQMPARKVINPLFSLLYHRDESIKWAAVSSMGGVVRKLADEDMEAARIIMRRLMWNLNDESGGIGWGSPEAMGEILARHADLAGEYAPILKSYARKNGNYLEHELLQRGLIWGIGRISQVRPHLVRDAAGDLIPYLESPDATVRGLTAWTMGLLGVAEARQGLERLREDEAEIQNYVNRRLLTRLVKDLASESLRRLASRD